MSITTDEVEHIARLARLRFEPEEIEKFRAQLSAILDYVAKLNELDTGDVEPTSHALDLEDVVREDTVRPSLPAGKVLGNAPRSADGHFCVPPVIE